MEFANDEVNSHMPNLPKYRRMLTLWAQSESRLRLTPDAAIRIFQAGQF